MRELWRIWPRAEAFGTSISGKIKLGIPARGVGA